MLTRTCRADSAIDFPEESTVVFSTGGFIESARYGLDEGMARLRCHAAAFAQTGLDEFWCLFMQRVRLDDNDDDVAVIVIRLPESGVLVPR